MRASPRDTAGLPTGRRLSDRMRTDMEVDESAIGRDRGSAGVTLSSHSARSPAVSRAAAILDALASEAPGLLGPSELARRVGFPKSTVINICNSLVDADFARRSEGGYGLGHKLVQLGAAYLSSVDLVRVFYEVHAEYGGAISETVQLAALRDGLDVVYLARAQGKRPVRLVSDIGRVLPATCTGTGKALLALLPEDELLARVPSDDVLAALTPTSVRTVKELFEQLECARRLGYAIDDEETAQGAFCVAAAVPTLGPEGAMAAVSITVLKAGVTDERIVELAAIVRGIAQRLGERLQGGAYRAHSPALPAPTAK